MKNKSKNKIVCKNKNKSKMNWLNLMILNQKLFNSQNNLIYWLLMIISAIKDQSKIY